MNEFDKSDQTKYNAEMFVYEEIFKVEKKEEPQKNLMKLGVWCLGTVGTFLLAFVLCIG